MGPGVADRGRRLVPERSDREARQLRRIGALRPGHRRAFHVHGVELAVAAVVGIELELADAAAVSRVVIETVENSATIAAAVEIEIGRQRLRLSVEDVDRAVHVGDEQPARAAGFFANRVDARQHAVDLTRSVDVARNRQRREIRSSSVSVADESVERPRSLRKRRKSRAAMVRRMLITWRRRCPRPAESCRRSCCRCRARRSRRSRDAHPHAPGWRLSAARRGALPCRHGRGRSFR